MAITDKLTQTRDGGNPAVATVSSARSSGGTSLSCDDLSNWPNDTVHFITYQKTSAGGIDYDTLQDFKGIVSGNTIGTVTSKHSPTGTDLGNSIGDYVEMAPTSSWAQDLYDGLSQTLDVDGTLKSTIVGLTNTNFGADKGILGDTEYFTSSGTWTKPANLKFVIVEVQGGGGGGGGAAATTTNVAVAGSGGGGGYTRKKILAAGLSASETVTVGAGGTAGAAGNNNGGNGGASSFGSHCSADGGGGGDGSAATGTIQITGNQASGGSATGGDLNIPGGNGQFGFTHTTSRTLGTVGGGSFYSNQPAQTGANVSSSSTGATGKNYGGGASGAVNTQGQTATAGGAGAPGIVIVHEYF
jgi:hypothetical protein